MKKINKKNCWELIRIIFYVLCFLFGWYIMMIESENQYVTKMFICGGTLFFIGLVVVVWQVTKLHFAMKRLDASMQKTKDIFERVLEKTEAAAKESKELAEAAEKN